MDAEARNRFFAQLHELWVQPALAQRAAEGRLPTDFKIWRCLIRLPNARAPIVDFNDEIPWLANLELSPRVQPVVGTPVYWDQVQRVKSVRPPEVENRRVAFVYLFKIARGYGFIFDFSPNISEETLPASQRADWKQTFGPAIAETLQGRLLERTVNIDPAMETQLECIGLWPAPALAPYPLGEIIRRLAEGDPIGAREVLVRHCTPQFLTDMTAKWWTLQEFQLRRSVLQDAVAAHGEGRYALSIHALLPQLEGIITDWVLTRMAPAEMPFRQESKTKKFRELLLAGPPNGFTYRRIVESSVRFILDGPVLATFKNWLDDVDAAFPNRNAVGHGRHDDAIFTEENSTKILLLLDTLYYLMKAPTRASDDPPGAGEA